MMNSGKPMGIQLIVGFYVFGGLALITSIFTGASQEIGIANRLGLPSDFEVFSRISLAFLAFFMAYGLSKLSKWGFWLFIVYNIYFLSVSTVLYLNTHYQLFFGNSVWSLLMLIYMAIHKRDFGQKIKDQDAGVG